MTCTHLLRARNVAALLLAILPVSAFATDLRIVEYNSDESDQGNNNNVTGPNNGFAAIMQAIGQQSIQGDSQPIDVLLLTELLDTNNNSLASTTLPAMTNALNAIYGAGTYAYDATPDATSGGTQFNGPSGMIYNTKTVEDLGGDSLLYSGNSSNTNPRAPIRFEVQPVGYGSNADFYVYVSHMKADESSSDKTARGQEATIVRNNIDTLPANASVIYTGDFNSSPPEAEFTNVTASGQGQMFDPENFSTSTQWFSESTDNLEYRDDYAFMTSNIINDTGPIGYVPGSFEVFGNNGTTPEHGETNAAGNTSLNSLNTPSNPTESTTILNDLMQPYGSDHLPTVSDYTINLAPPATTWAAIGGGNWGTSANWAGGVIPKFQTQSATFGPSITAASTVTLSGAWSVGTITFNSTNSYTIAQGTGSPLTIDNGASPAAINVITGNHTLATAMVLNSTVVFAVSNSNNVLSVPGAISGTGGLTVSGSGTVSLSGSNSYAGPTMVSSGVLVVGSAGAIPAKSALTIGAASTSGVVQLAQGIGTVVVPSLTINSGTMDVTNNSVVVNYAGSADPISSIVSYLQNGYAGTGPAIVSSAAAAANASQSALIYEVGYADGADGITAVPSGQIEIMPTIAGDAKLAGNVVFGDFQLLAANFGSSAGWDGGNFTYGSVVNFGDFQLLAQDFGANASQLASSELASMNSFAAEYGEKLLANPSGVGYSLVAVPEPTSIGLVILGGALFARRRRN